MFSQTNVDEVNLQMRPHLVSLMSPKPFHLLTLGLFSLSKVFLCATTGHDTSGYKTDWLTEAHPSKKWIPNLSFSSLPTLLTFRDRASKLLDPKVAKFWHSILKTFDFVFLQLCCCKKVVTFQWSKRIFFKMKKHPKVWPIQSKILKEWNKMLLTKT